MSTAVVCMHVYNVSVHVCMYASRCMGVGCMHACTLLVCLCVQYNRKDIQTQEFTEVSQRTHRLHIH